MYKVSFNNKDRAFQDVLIARVEEYFQSAKLRKTGNWRLYAKTLILIPSALGIYLSLLLLPLSTPLALLLCVALGLVLASIGFNVMHDACHGSFSSRSWVNNLLGHTLNALGGNAFIWKFKHNIIHHTYTNVDGIDDDIAKSPLMRQCPSQKWVPAHRFQHLYVIAVYAISSLAWVSLMDFNKYFSKRVHNTPLQKMKASDHLVFWLSKILYVLFYVALPVYFVGWVPWLIGFSVMHLSLGFTLAIVFQLAHVVEHASFVHADANNHQKIEDAWAIHQVKTTANFATKNKLISWYVGGLNFQVEHHLFPRISHIHYPAINSIVIDTCRQFNIPYNEFPSMRSAIASHFRMMKQLGQKPDELPMAA